MLPHDRHLSIAASRSIVYSISVPDGMSDKKLIEKLYSPSAEKPVFKMPNYEYVHKELQKSGVPLKLLGLEYCETWENWRTNPPNSTSITTTS